MKSPEHITSSELPIHAAEVIGWYTALLALHQRMRWYFARPEPFQRALRFLQGILSEVPRKNGWQLAEQAREATPYGMQRLLSDAVWDENGMRDEVRHLAMETLGHLGAVVAID